MIPVICNFTAQPEIKAEKLKENIISQVTKKGKMERNNGFYKK